MELELNGVTSDAIRLRLACLKLNVKCRIMQIDSMPEFCKAYIEVNDVTSLFLLGQEVERLNHMFSSFSRTEKPGRISKKEARKFKEVFGVDPNSVCCEKEVSGSATKKALPDKEFLRDLSKCLVEMLRDLLKFHDRGRYRLQ